MKQLLTLACAVLVAATTAHADVRRQKNLATRLSACFYNVSTGALIGGATGVDCEYAQGADGTNYGTFADFTNAEAEIATSSGCFQWTTTAGEMNSDYVAVKCSSSSTNAVPVTYVVDTLHGTVLSNASGQLAASTVPAAAFASRGTAQSASSSTLVMAASEAFADNELQYNTAVTIVSSTTGQSQTRCICGNTGSSDTLTLCSNWTTTPTGTITYDLQPAPNCNASGGVTASTARKW